MTGRIPTLEEIAEDLGHLSAAMARMEEKLDQRFVPRELYEARHTALRSEVALELAKIMSTLDADRQAAHTATAVAKAEAEAAVANLRNETTGRVKAVEAVSNSSRQLALWCLGVLATALISGAIGFLIKGGA